jgi:hypothetical protein
MLRIASSLMIPLSRLNVCGAMGFWGRVFMILSKMRDMPSTLMTAPVGTRTTVIRGHGFDGETENLDAALIRGHLADRG